jgi:hypothetical protein
MKKILFATMALVAFKANAQKIQFGGIIGVVSANQKITAGSAKEKIGLSFGLLGNYNFSRTIALQSGIGFSSRGRSVEHAGHNDNYSVSTLEIPLNVLVKTKAGKGNWYAGMGPNFGFNVAAKVKSHDEPDEKVEIGNNAGELRMFDFGINFITGYEFKNKLFIQLNSNIGLSNLSNVPNFSQKSSVIGLSLGYFFGK